VTNELVAWAGAIFLVVAFVWLVFLFKAPSHLKRVLEVSQGATAALGDPNATDEDKEKAAQQSSMQLFGLFLLILASFAGALLLPVAALWLLGKVHLISFDAVMALATSITFLVGATVVGCAIAFVLPRLRALQARK